jgi:DNA-binding GntR family transcriptional regulator
LVKAGSTANQKPGNERPITVEQPVIDVTNINEKVYDFLKKGITDLTYTPGERINVRQLQHELGVSQTPIKDALFRLAGEGMVEISSRRGTFVTEVTERDIREIAETRIILETGAVEIVAKRITAAQLMELEALYRATLIEDESIGYDSYMERDSQFHLKIIEFTNNERLLKLYKQLNAHMQIVRFRFARRAKRKLSWTDEDHARILEAIKEHDAQKAVQTMREHLLRARDAFLKEHSENG